MTLSSVLHGLVELLQACRPDHLVDVAVDERGCLQGEGFALGHLERQWRIWAALGAWMDF